MVLLRTSKLDQGHYTYLNIYLNPLVRIIKNNFLVMDTFGFIFFFLPYETRIASFKLEFYLKEKTQ